MQIRESERRGKGFHMTFANGYTISVQWHDGAYTSRRANVLDETDVEIALWDPDGEWCTKDAVREIYAVNAYDDVEGYVRVDEIVKFMTWAQARPTKPKAHINAGEGI